MRYVVYGAGGIGCAIGGRLFQDGCDVVLIARGEHLRAIQARGLTLKTPAGLDTIHVPAVGHPRDLKFTDDDVVMLAMKTQDTEPALRDLVAASDGRDLSVVCAQNGVENERLAARRFSRVYGMTVWLPAVFLEPGVVINHAGPREGVLDSGRFPGGVDRVIERVCADLEASRFAARAVPDVMRWKYSKLLTNLRTTLFAVCGEDTVAPELVAKLQDEARACYAAAGIEFAPHEEEQQRREQAGVTTRPVDGQRRVAGSAWQSLTRELGSIETDYINGEIVTLGLLHGVPTPYNRAVQQAANRVARERKRPGAYSLEDVERLAQQLAAAR